MTYFEQLKSLVLKLKDANIPEEEILEKDVVRALSVLNYIAYLSVADIFLGCAAVNLLNAYVKRKDSKVSYSFKCHLGPILNAIARLRPLFVTVGYDNSRNWHMLQIDFKGFQFSYKAIKQSDFVKQLSGKALEWDGVRKQPYARTIFDFALSSEFLSDETLDHSSLREKISSDCIDHDKGAFVFRDGRIVKIANIDYKKERLTPMANYLREKLLEAQGELVLLEGNFAKVYDRHVTFTSVRPHISRINSVIACDHINLKKDDLQRFVDLPSLKKGHSYFILGYCRPYSGKDGAERIGVNLAMDLGHSPILGMDEFKVISKSTFERLHRFPIDKFIACKEKELIYR